MSRPSVRVRVWDLPIRLFHWSVVVLLIASWVTERNHRMQWHFLIGYTMIAALLFRLVWGFAGSDTARFKNFLKSPFFALHHLSGLHRREPDREVGHNAAGGWMVLLMLLLLAIQAGTGLCSNDQIAAEGPLAHLVGSSRSDQLSAVHSFNFTLIEIAIVVHVVAVLTYRVLKGHDLVRPMVTGFKELPADTKPPRMVRPVVAGAVFATAGALVAAGVSWLGG